MQKGMLTGLAALLAASATACGDGPICPSEIVLVLTSLEQGANVTGLNDVDPDAPGIQLDINVRSNLRSGDSIELTLTDADSNVSTYDATADKDGNATFESVTLPGGTVTLEVAGTSEHNCGGGSDQVEITVVPEAACDLAINEGPIANDFYDPLPVLNTTNDSDPDQENFQGHISVDTAPGFQVELFVLDVAAGEESSAGEETATGEGQAEFAVTLDQGSQAIRATCVGPGGISAASATHTVFVDTVAPEQCNLNFPAPGAFVTPDDDEDGDANGVQLTMRGSASATDDDVEGEETEFTFGAVSQAGTLLTDGESTAQGVFGSPGTVPVSFKVQDHAGNPCVDEGTVQVDIDGCSIVHEAPEAGTTVVTDSDNAPGFQTDIVVQVDPDCEGLTVTTDCGGGGSATVPSDGRTTIPVTLSDKDNAQGSETCQSEITATSGYTTFAGAMFNYDNKGPATQLDFTDPSALSCGEVVTTADDADGNSANGVQVEVLVVAPDAASQSVDVTNASGTTQYPVTSPGTPILVTLDDGDNNLVARTVDDNGNAGHSQDPCTISLEGIAIGFSPPIDDGLVGSPDDKDGDVSSGTITLDLCGTVSTPNADVEVDIDGAGAQNADSIPGDGTWCLTGQELSESLHTIDVQACDPDCSQSGVPVGTNSLSLLVDLTPPDAPTDLTASVLTRQSVLLSWTAPADNGGAAASYLAKRALVPLTEGNFDSTGVQIATPTPSSPGSTDTTTVEQLRAGAEYHFAVAAVDTAGNRSVFDVAGSATYGPVIPDFDPTGRIDPPNACDPADSVCDNKGFGYSLARGDFNDDGYGDLAVGAPFTNLGPDNDSDGLPDQSAAGVVYVYFGGPAGIGTSPDVTIDGPLEFAEFGHAITATDFDGDAVADLAVGAPRSDGGNGRVYVFSGKTGFAPTSFSDADATITVGGGKFDGGGLGWGLASARFDGDSKDDLVISAWNLDGGKGGVLVLYGGSGETDIVLDDTAPAGMGAAVGHLLVNPIPAADFGLFGNKIFNLGRTEGSADTRDDIGISYFADYATDPDHVVILRGRPSADKPASGDGIELLTLNSSVDLVVQNDSSDPDGSTYFGDSMGTVPDLDNDAKHARDIVIGAPRSQLVTIVSGSATGNPVLMSDITITSIGGAGVTRFGSKILNAADGLDATNGLFPDIDTDGIDDLVILGGSPAPKMYVWFGDTIPLGSTDSSSADHTISAPAAFDNAYSLGQDIRLSGIWAGDVNGDGLEDICWADYAADPGGHGAGEEDGAIEVLWDDPTN